MGWFEWAERSEAQVEAEIADEIEFHLEQRTRALVEAGMGTEEARAEAERRFGSLERVRKDCRWVQLGERIMLQRIQVGLNVVLLAAVAALGLSYWKMMGLIILPQALKVTIPNIVNNNIALFKDTTLVFVVGIFDFLRTIEVSRIDPKWATPVTSTTGYAFAAIFYFICCWMMARYARGVERRLATGYKR